MGGQGSPDGARFYSLGLEFAAAIVGLSLLGYWIDHHFGSAPWGVLIGLGLGLVGGGYNLYRAARQWSRSFEAGGAAHTDDTKNTEEKLDGDQTP